MQVKEYTYKSASGLVDIKAWQWYNENKDVKAVIQMHHGMAEHSGRYKNFIKAFTDLGYAVFMNDMINHGKSNDDKSLLGYFGDKDGYKNIIRDAHTLSNIAKKEYPDKKFIIAGHSMGSLIMRSYINMFGNDFDGAIFIGTSGSNPVAKTGLVIIDTVGKVKGLEHKSPLINKIGFSAYDKPFEHRTSYDWGTRDTKSVDDYVADEYCGYLFSVAGYRDLSLLVMDCNSDDWFKNVAKDMPVLLTSGTMDPVGNYTKGVKEVYQRLLDTGHSNVTLKFYENARHEILNELNKEEVYSNINQWIEKNVL
jgi:alpha-beta hydrolase superfamily lysophospholipase